MCLLQCTISFSAFQKVGLTRINLKSQQIWAPLASASCLESQSHNLGSGLTPELQSRAMATKLHFSQGQHHFQTISSLHGGGEPRALQNLQEGEGCHHPGCCITGADNTMGSSVILYEHFCWQTVPFCPILYSPCSSGVTEEERLCLGCVKHCRISSLVFGHVLLLYKSCSLFSPALYLWLPS